MREAATEKPGKVISDHFAEIDKLTEGAPGAQPIDQTLKALDDLSKTLLTMGDFSDAAGQPNPQLLLAQQAAGQLPPPAAGWFAALTGKSQALVESGTKSALDDQYQQAVGKDCADFTRGRYPFSPSSNNDIPLQNFGDLFGYGGRFDSFYNQTASKLIDASGRYWHWKTGPGAVSGSPGMLAQLQGADGDQGDVFPQRQRARSRLHPAGPGRSTRASASWRSTSTARNTNTRPAAPTNVAMKWPGPQPGRVSISA